MLRNRLAIQPSTLYVVITVLIAFIYVVDWRTPLGFTPWLFYLIPIGLTYLTPHVSGPIIVATICTAMLYVGFLTSPPGVPERLALANRSVGAVIFLVAAVFLARYKEVTAQLQQTSDDFAADLKERTQDLRLAVQDLQREIADRHRAEQGVRDAWAEVELRVQERMHVLTEVNVSLREKILLLESTETRLTGRRLEMDDAKADLERLETDLRRLHGEKA
jgi:hypothetical protein